MKNLYWAIARKSDGYILETIGRCNAISNSDAEFLFKKKNIRDAFELVKCEIKIKIYAKN